MSEKLGGDGRVVVAAVVVDGVSYDRCVSCWVRTKYLTATPIYERRFYVKGAGQLCEACFHKIYDSGR